MRAELQTLHATIDVANAAQRWVTRSSLRLMLDDGCGNRGVGEAAPLPGWSKESVRDARDELAAVVWPAVAPTERDAIASFVSTIELPSARFAAETALLSMAASIRGVPLYAMFSEHVSAIPVAWTLFGNDRAAMLRSAREAAALQVPAIKVKIGAHPLVEEVELLERIRKIVGPRVELRLDANRSLPADKLPEIFETLAPFRPSYIEEPTKIEETLALSSIPFPVALDESIVEGGDALFERAMACEHVGAVVLKPTLLGGLERCYSLSQRAHEHNKRAILSHALESVIARAAIAHLALVVGESAPGLGDHPALEPLSRGLDTSWIELAEIEPPAAKGLGLELAW